MFVTAIYFSISLSVYVLAGGVGDTCVTPNGEVAKCTLVTQCDVINTALKNKEEGSADFAKRSFCGKIRRIPLVCCGSVGKITKIEPPPPCITPNGEPASCIPVSLCPLLSKALVSNLPDAIQFAKNSKCGHDDKKQEDLYCCGSEAFPIRTKLLPNRTACGEQKGDVRIHGGNITQIWEYPWMALLRYKYNATNEDAGFQCGGTIINNRYILTAAHCIYPKQPLYLDGVRVGEWNISTEDDCGKGVPRNCADPVVDMKIEEKIVHPEFSSRHAKNDIALLRLDNNIQFTNYIQPVCLPVAEAADPSPNSKMIVVGWGVTENETTSDVKLKLEVPIVSRDVCKAKLTSIDGIGSSHICAGGEAGKDACQGDSGGPLMRSGSENLNAKPRWYQEGIVSKGAHCGIRGYPAIYTRVANYIGWIIENLKD